MDACTSFSEGLRHSPFALKPALQKRCAQVLRSIGSAITGKSSSKAPACRVCNKDLTDEKDYSKRHRVCHRHLKQLLVSVDGQPSRWCHQCAKFHGIKQFDQDRRTCRMRLTKLRVRRQAKEEATSDSDQGADESILPTNPTTAHDNTHGETHSTCNKVPGWRSPHPLHGGEARQTIPVSNLMLPSVTAVPALCASAVPAPFVDEAGSGLDDGLNMDCSPNTVNKTMYHGFGTSGSGQLNSMAYVSWECGMGPASQCGMGEQQPLQVNVPATASSIPAVQPMLQPYNNEDLARHAAAGLNPPTWHDLDLPEPASAHSTSSQAKWVWPPGDIKQEPHMGDLSHHIPIPAQCLGPTYSSLPTTPQALQLRHQLLQYQPLQHQPVQRQQQHHQPLQHQPLQHRVLLSAGTPPYSSSNSLAAATPCSLPQRPGSFTSPMAPMPYKYSMLGRTLQATRVNAAPWPDVLPASASRALDMELQVLMQDMGMSDQQHEQSASEQPVWGSAEQSTPARWPGSDSPSVSMYEYEHHGNTYASTTIAVQPMQTMQLTGPAAHSLPLTAGALGASQCTALCSPAITPFNTFMEKTPVACQPGMTCIPGWHGTLNE